MSSLLLSVVDVADLLGVSRSWVYAHRDQLPAPVRVGGATRWRRTDIERWVDTLPPHDMTAATATGAFTPSRVGRPAHYPRLGVVAS